MASADHLLMVSEEGIQALAESGVIPILLPGTAFSLRKLHAPARKMLDAGLPWLWPQILTQVPVP